MKPLNVVEGHAGVVKKFCKVRFQVECLLEIDRVLSTKRHSSGLKTWKTQTLIFTFGLGVSFDHDSI